MAAIDMNAQLREWVAKAINEGCMGEEFGFDVSWGIQPPTVVYTLVITMKNPMLGKGPIVMPFTVPLPALREDAVRMGVHHTMGQLRGAYKKILDAGPQPVASSSN